MSLSLYEIRNMRSLNIDIHKHEKATSTVNSRNFKYWVSFAISYIPFLQQLFFDIKSANIGIYILLVILLLLFLFLAIQSDPISTAGSMVQRINVLFQPVLAAIFLI